MTLDQLLLALPDPIRMIGGDATQLDVWRVLEVDADAPPLAGTIYLAGDAAAVAMAIERFGAHVDVAVLAPEGVWRALPGGGRERFVALGIAGSRVPLDLAARVQRVLSDGGGEGVGAAGVTAARQALVDDVLNARFQDPHAVTVRARALGLHLDGLHVVVLVAVDDFERFYLQHEREGEAYFQRLRGTVSLLLRQEAQRVSAHGAVVPLGDAAVALLPGLDAARAVAAEVAARARRELRLVPVVVGVGGEKAAWTQLSASYREAVLALRLRRRLRLRTRHVAFADVTGSALLELLEHTPEVRGLLTSAIAPLVAADRAHRSRLVETLAAWFDAGTSLKGAASALGVHPKTLRYRMDRIGDLLGQGALEGDRRLLYYVAARLHLWTQG